jgi:hypothetical protein
MVYSKLLFFNEMKQKNCTNSIYGMANIGCISLIAFLSSFSSAKAEGTSGVGGKELSAHVASCPDTRSGMIFAPVLAGLAASTASNLTGSAIDAISNYLTKERAATSEVSLPLEEQQLSELFGKSKCFYVYLNTPRLVNYLKTNAISWDKPETLTPKFVNDVRSLSLTNFFSVMRFARPKSLAAQQSGDNSFFRPEIQSWHYNRFIDPHCPLFRSCSKRDVLIRLEVAYPRNPAAEDMPLRSIPLAVGLSGTRAPEVGSILTRPSSLAWFSFSTKSPQIANLRFSITETSKPGALANAIGSSLQASKKSIQDVVQRTVYTPPESQLGFEQTAFSEYKKYVDSHEAAYKAFLADMSNPGNRDTYALLRAQALTQLKIAKAAWNVARISARFNELPPLPNLP